MTNQTRTEPLDRLAELEQAATPGPWRRIDTGSEGCSILSDASRFRIARLSSGSLESCQDDAAFIAELRNAAPSLIAEARAAARLRSALEAALAWYNDYGDAVFEGRKTRPFPADALRAALVKP